MTNPAFSIFKKDLKILLKSPMFYFLIGLSCCFWGFFFAFQVLVFVNQSFQLSTRPVHTGMNIHQDLVAGYIAFVHYFLILVIAALSLRFFTEEKKLNTFSLLLSSPVSSREIVLGKSLFGVTSLLIFLCVSAIYPLSLFFFIKIPVKLFLLAYFGVFLILCIYMTAGLLASILTDSLVVCVILTVIFTILLMLLGTGREFTEIRALREVFNFLSLNRHFDFFRKGVLNLSSVFYFLSWSFLLGFITERLVEFHRWR